MKTPQQFCLTFLMTLSSLSLADVDPRAYIDPSLQANVVLGSQTYYNNYFNADGEQTQDIPATLGCLAARNIKALQEAQSKCSADVADARDAAAKLAGATQAFGAVADSAQTVGDSVDVVGNAAEKIKEAAGYGENFSKDQASRNKRQKNKAGTEKWDKRARKCKSAGGALKKALGKINLAKETADWVGWVCECAEGYCADWEGDVYEEIEDTTGACKEISSALAQWGEIEQQAEGTEEACED